jgi:hypothetical protein
MDAISLLRSQLNIAHQTMEGTMEGVTPEMAHWMPPGRANPIGASYAHVVQAEDAIVNGIFKQQAPMFASQWLNKTGFSEPMPTVGPEWANYAAWTRRVKVDLPALREFAQAVYANTEQYLADLKPEDLDRRLDLSSIGMGHVNLGWAISMLVIGHINNIAGEISCLKGVQGAQGYPF